MKTAKELRAMIDEWGAYVATTTTRTIHSREATPEQRQEFADKHAAVNAAIEEVYAENEKLRERIRELTKELPDD